MFVDVVQREMGRIKRKVPSVESVNEKRHLLDTIVWRDSALAIEHMFGPYSWEQFGKLKETSWIVVVGNGPVRQFHQNRIDNAELVIRCNHYGEILQEPLARKKLGSKCDSLGAVAAWASVSGAVAA